MALPTKGKTEAPVDLSGSAEASSGSAEASSGSAEASSGSAEASKGSAEYSEGSDEASEGSAEYSEDSNEDSEGSAEYSEGSGEDSSSENKVSTCKDKKKNQDETDIDCGGNKCKKCADKKKCKVDQDCISDFCNKKKCTKQSTKPTKKTTQSITTSNTVTTTTAPATTTTPATTTAPATTTTPETTTAAATTTTPATTTIAETTTTPAITTTTSPTCDFECKNNGICTGHNNCTCTTGFSGPTCEVQSVGLCLDDETFGAEPILLITFGHGPTQYSTARPADFHFSTTYQQRFEPVTNDGMFSFVNSIHNDFDGVWHTNATDHSGDTGGYMYLVNADITPGQFYNGRVDNLCIGLRYEFSVYLANLCKPSDRINPNVLFEVRSVSGNVLLAQLNSGDIVAHDNLTWEKYGFSFIASDSSVNLLMISNADGGNGNDIVIDDIALNVCAHEGTGFCPTN
jgi:hypothetical protein